MGGFGVDVALMMVDVGLSLRYLMRMMGQWTIVLEPLLVGQVDRCVAWLGMMIGDGRSCKCDGE